MGQHRPVSAAAVVLHASLDTALAYIGDLGIAQRQPPTILRPDMGWLKGRGTVQAAAWHARGETTLLPNLWLGHARAVDERRARRELKLRYG